MDEAALAARSLLAMEVARRAVTTLAQARIDVMPLKGVLFRAIGLAGSETRYVGDVDLLVRSERHDEAVRLLERAGFREVARVSHAVTMWSEELGFHLDLHRRLFPRGWFRMRTSDVFARAERNGDWLLMDPYDIYAHLVGHFVVGRLNGADERHVRDFGDVVRHFELEAGRVARRLEDVGLERAARYVLRETAGPFARAVLAELGGDVGGDVLALLAHAVLTRWPGSARPAAAVSRFFAL